jgi:hypothetical protein
MTADQRQEVETRLEYVGMLRILAGVPAHMTDRAAIDAGLLFREQVAGRVSYRLPLAA